MPTRTKKNKKNNKKTKKLSNTVEETKEDKFSFDQEIVIGLKRIEEPKNTNKKTKKLSKKEKNKLKKKEKQNVNYYRTKSKENEIQNNAKNNKAEYKKKRNNKTQRNKSNKQGNQLTQKQKLAKKRRKFVLKICKWLTLFCIIIGGIIYAMLSPIFNITSIEVAGNSKISSETILSLSGLTISQNIFNFSTSQVRNNIKQNAYIESVEIDRSLPDKVRITVEERVATYVLTIGNAYAYINNQGYILEITASKGNYPIISDYETPVEQIKEGSRLIVEDLEKLNDVLKIMEAVSIGDNSISKLITQIDISNKNNYILTLEKEKKSIYLGDTSNLSTKVLLINQILKEEKDKEGIIYLNVDLNTESPYFRETV